MLQAHLIKNNFLTSNSVHAVHKTKSNLTLYILPSHTLYTKQKGDCTAMYSLLFALFTLFIPRYITILGYS